MMAIKCNICGMEINEKNFKLNKGAFLRANDLDNLTYCPFCGARLDAIDKPQDFYFNNCGTLDDNTLRILDHAMKLEVFNSEFYDKASSMTANEKLKERFKDLARIEITHARIHQKLGGFKELPKLSQISYDRFKNDDDLIFQAMLREKHAVEYYSKYTNNIANIEIKEVLEILNNVEKEHIQLLES